MQAILRVLVLFALIAIAEPAYAEDRFDPGARAGVIAPFIDEQTIAVVHVDFSRVEVDPFVDALVRLIPEARGLEESREPIEQTRAAVLKAGANDVYSVLSLAGPKGLHPFAVVPLRDSADADALIRFFSVPGGPASPPVVKRLRGGLFLGRRDALERVQDLEPDPRPALVEAFEAAGDTAVQILLLPTPTHRRIVEEMMPELPEQVGGGPSTVLTHGMLWAAFGVNTPPDASLRGVIRSKDTAAAAAFHVKLVEGIRVLARHALGPKHFEKADQAVALLNLEARDDRITLHLSRAEGLPELVAVFARPVEEARQRARRSQASNQLKQLGLAMHNWYDVHKSFPAVANFDAAGRPLLSWRVHVLPFVDERELYEEFHLDEPWDSDHNRKLIGRMPDEVYRSPASKLKEKGRTNYVVPVGEQTAFPGRQGIEFKEIKDGTSNTIMIVEVGDPQAVVWTKPEDLPWDPANPAKGLGGPFEGGFNTTFCDGSARFIKLPADPETLRALFTRAGGEPIDYGKL